MISRLREVRGYDPYIDGQKGEWFMVDFGEKARVKLTHYSLEHLGSGLGLMRGWDLEASQDAQIWNILKRHTSDQTLQYKTKLAATFEVEACHDFYRYFRIRNTEKQHHGWWEITAGILDFYGMYLE